jgi:hypothetical protein
VIQDVLVVAVHAHPAGADTVTVCGVALLLTDSVVGLTLNVQAAPSCAIVTAWPAIVVVAVRWLELRFDWTDTENVRLPVPLVPLSVAHMESDEAVQAQPVWVVMYTVTVVGPAETVVDSGVTVYVQPAGAACVIATVWPAIVTVPVRDDVPVLAAIVSVTVPPPLPLVDESVIQDDEVDAVHVHPAAEVTVTS